MSERERSSYLLVVDTNVWLDLFIPGRPHAEETREFFVRAAKKEANILYTMQTVNDVYAQVGFENKRWVRQSGVELSEPFARAIKETSWDCVLQMREVGTLVGADVSDLWLACKYRSIHDDLEDNLVLAACQRTKADYLITNDAKLIRHATVAALTPADMSKLLQL